MLLLPLSLDELGNGARDADLRRHLGEVEEALEVLLQVGLFLRLIWLGLGLPSSP